VNFRLSGKNCLKAARFIPYKASPAQQGGAETGQAGRVRPGTSGPDGLLKPVAARKIQASPHEQTMKGHYPAPMAVTIKTPEEQEKMRVAGRLAADVLDMIGEHVVPGVTTDELDSICHEFIVGPQDAIPAPLNYRGFPKSICTSVNHVVCHGIPGDKRLKSGDIVNIDITVIKDGFHGDTSRMFRVGESSVLADRLIDACHESMWAGIREVRPGATLGDVGHAVQTHAESNRFSIVREYCGHGIGRIFHEDPQVLHYGTRGTGLELRAGMTFTVEPMINAGKREVKLLADGWTVVTKDHSLSAQWEHTVLVTDDGVEILTLGAAERTG
jgi:methionyl aminopeptidase